MSDTAPMTDPYDPTPTPPPGPQPRKGMPAWGWILIAVGALGVICCAGAVVLGLFVNKAADAGDSDVTVATCGTDTATGWPRAVLAITNSDDRPHDYFVNVAFEKAGTQVGTAFAAVSDLAAGQSAVEDAVALGKEGSGFTCRITNVSRS